jgi:hypothetical protein
MLLGADRAASHVVQSAVPLALCIGRPVPRGAVCYGLAGHTARAQQCEN